MKRHFFVIILFVSCSPKIINNNLAEHEKSIYWNENRPLRISDFNGSTEKRPFQAATNSGLKVMNPVNAWSGKTKVVVKSYFNPELSYFKNSDRDSSVLAHEQLHFDITELYARKLKKVIIQECPNTYEYFKKRDSLYNRISLELSEKQDEYDSEVYTNRSLQLKWNDWIKNQLIELIEYADKEIELKTPLFYSKNK